MTLEFRISGIVYERETRRPLPNLIVRAYDRDLLYDDLLSDTKTDESGRFEMRYTGGDFKELFEQQPDVYFRIYDPSGARVIHTTADSVRWNAGADEYFEIAIPRHKLPPAEEDTLLVDSQGTVRTEFEVGDSLLVNFRNLSPSKSYAVRLLDDTGEEIISASLISDRHGVVEPTVLWPDIGIGDRKGGRFMHETYEEALKELAGRAFTLEMLDDGHVIQTTTFRVAKTMDQPRLYPASESGGLQRGLLLGRDEVRVRGRNYAPGSLVDVYLVERQYDWRTGDPIVPVRNVDGSEVLTRVQLPADETDFAVTLWPLDEIRPGSYDIVARTVVAHEYRADERVLRETDIVSDRLITTLVIRDEIYRVKPVDLGCVNALEIVGKSLPGSPYFKFTNNFPEGTNVFAALDPAGLMPEAVGKKVRYYVVAHKDAAQWSADPSLIDVTGTASEVIMTSSCINGNKTLVWANPQQAGQYDLVVDFGNNDPNPANFVADDSFDPPLDMIDGYFKVGFHVTDDPSVRGDFEVGETSYDEPAVSIPAVGVWAPPPWNTLGNTPSGTLSLPLKAEVRYPADISGINVDVSPRQAPHPLVVVMHGMHSYLDPSYLGYNDLLDHLASHGFIAVSIDCNPINAIDGMQDTRAHAILEHLSLLESMNSSPGLFLGKIDMTRVGIMGHSRGGDGVVQAEIYNQSLGLGFNIRAMVTLAPTDFSGTSPSPLILSTSKFLCIYGSNDGDVWGGPNPSTAYTATGFRFYDRATVEKAMVFVYGATHNRFNTVWGTEYKVDASSAEVLLPEQHEMLLSGYMTAFMQAHLQGRAEQLDYFNGELRIPQVDEVEVHAQYHLPTPPLLTLDDFESLPQINKNILDGTVTLANLDGVPQEDDTGTLDVHSPHQTRGLKLKWNAATATYQSEIPLTGDQRNVSGDKFLNFRVSQVVGSSANLADQPQDLYVRLSTAAGGPSRAVRVGYFDTIPFPYKPEYRSSYDGSEAPNTKAAMKTIRIPLHAWTIKCLSAPIVDLRNIESITFEFRLKPTGEILVDDIEFSE